MSENIEEGGSLSNKSDLIGLYSLSRCLDGMFWSLLFFYITLIATFQDFVFSTFPFLCCLPLFMIAYSSFKLPVDFIKEESWARNLQGLRTFSLIAAFTFPFIVFLVKADRDSYFAICSITAVYALLRMITAIARLSVLLGEFYSEANLAKEGKLSVFFIYVSMITAASYVFAVVSNPALINNLLNSGSLGLIIKVGVLIVIVFPLLLPVTLLFRLKTLIIFNTKEKLRKY